MVFKRYSSYVTTSISKERWLPYVGHPPPLQKKKTKRSFRLNDLCYFTSCSESFSQIETWKGLCLDLRATGQREVFIKTLISPIVKLVYTLNRASYDKQGTQKHIYNPEEKHFCFISKLSLNEVKHR